MDTAYYCFALTPALSRREREKSGTHYLAVGSVTISKCRVGIAHPTYQPFINVAMFK